MERILVIGSTGSGKTTLSRRLAAALHLPLVHLDQLYWRAGWTPVSEEEFNRLLLRELQKPRWILDGNYSRTVPLRLRYCDTVVYLDYPRLLCLWGVIKRVLTGYGEVRSDMGEGCPERFDLAFLKDTWNFPKRNRARYDELLHNLEGVQVVRLSGRGEARRFLQGLENELDKKRERSF